MEKGSIYEKYDKYIISYMNAQKVMDNLLSKGIIDEFLRKKVLETTSSKDRNICLLGILEKRVKEDIFLTALKETRCAEHEKLLKVLQPKFLPNVHTSIEDEKLKMAEMKDRLRHLKTENKALKQELKEKEKTHEEDSELIVFLRNRIKELEHEKRDLGEKIDSAHTKIQEMEEKHQKDMEKMQQQYGELKLMTEALKKRMDGVQSKKRIPQHRFPQK